MRSSFPLLAVALSCVLGRGQSLSWQIPHRGALVYTRSTELFTVSPPPTHLRMSWPIRHGDRGAHEWRYLALAAGETPAGFEQPGFDDSQWPSGRGEFGPDGARNARQRSLWNSAELCLRTTVDIGPRRPKSVLLRIDHDDGIRVYCNGQQILTNDGYGRGREYLLTGRQLQAFRAGDNLIAVKCQNIGGAQYLDFGLAVLGALPRSNKSPQAIQQAIRADQQAADRIRRELFAAFRPPPLLLQGELDASQQRVAMPPADLRELAWWIATNLQIGVQGGTRTIVARRMHRLGDVHVRYRAAATDANGWQTITAQLKTSPELAPGNDSNRYIRQFVRPHVGYGCSGELTIRRRLQRHGDRATIAEFRTELHGRVLTGRERQEHAATVEQVESWRLESVRENQDAAFRAGVADALQRGTAALKKLLEQPAAGKLSAQPKNGARSYHSGRLAIGLLALVKGGLAKDDPVVVQGFEELRQRPLIDSYSLGNAIMALEALYAPASEAADIKQGVITEPRMRQLPERDQRLMQRWTEQLLGNIDTRVDPTYLLRFNYTRGGRYDHSVNQYGLLGLYSAHLCGIELPSTVWEAAANHLLAHLSEGDERLHLVLTDFRALAHQQADPDATRTASPLPVRVSGWNYQGPRQGGANTPLWGAMVCAGITGLAICEAGLHDIDSTRHVKLGKAATAARHAAFGWLAENMTVRYHPGWIVRQQAFYYYYLYGLERAGMLSAIALIQDRDWYFEGALVLTLIQQADGQWPVELRVEEAVERCAMAVLFLKKGTIPVLTGQ